MEHANKDTQAAHARAAAEPETSRATAMADQRPASIAQRALAGWASSPPAQLAPDELQQQKSAGTAQLAPEPEEQEPKPA